MQVGSGRRVGGWVTTRKRIRRIAGKIFLVLAVLYGVLALRASYANHLYDVCHAGYDLQVPDRRIYGANGTFLERTPVTYILPAEMNHCELVVRALGGDISYPLKDCSPRKHEFRTPAGIRTADDNPETWTTNVNLNCSCHLPWWLFVKQ
jgi:hypothetical protein